MPKLENFATHIKVNGNPYAKNSINYQVQSDDTVGLYYTNDRDRRILEKTLARFDDWTNLNDVAYSSFNALIADLDLFLFVSYSELALDIPAGRMPGKSGVNKFGRNNLIAAGTTEEIWDGSATYVFPTSAVITNMSQTTDQVAMRGATIEWQGLDLNWDFVTNTTVLNASDTTTPVAFTTPMIRVFRGKVLANVVADSPIRAHNAAEDQDYAIILPPNNQTLMAIYTVPNGKTAYMTFFEATLNPATNQDPTSNQIVMWARDNDNVYAPQVKHTMGVTVGNHHHEFYPFKQFTQKTDIYITSSPVGKAADISAGFDLIIEDNI